MQSLQAGESRSEQDLVETALALVSSRRVKLVGIFRDKSPSEFAPAAKPVV